MFGFLVLACVALEWMAKLLLRVFLPGSDPSRVRPSGCIRRSFGVTRLGLLVVGAPNWDLVSVASDLFKGSTVTTAAPGYSSLGACA
jgi:hypothetical protein